MKCQICEKEVKSKKMYEGDFDSINTAVLGVYTQLKGHRVCLKNVNNFVVIPNRLRMINIRKHKCRCD